MGIHQLPPLVTLKFGEKSKGKSKEHWELRLALRQMQQVQASGPPSLTDVVSLTGMSQTREVGEGSEGKWLELGSKRGFASL